MPAGAFGAIRGQGGGKKNYIDILNFFDNRSTNASAESFNAKIKNFRTQLPYPSRNTKT